MTTLEAGAGKPLVAVPRSVTRAAPELVERQVLGSPVSVLVAHAERPRGVVFALHGGGSSKEYFDHPLDPSLSLLRLGPALGFTVIAPDRPGYVRGDNASTMPAAARTDLLYAILDTVLEGRASGGSVLLLAHSMGCVSAVRMAAHERGGALLGLELSGTGLRCSPSVREVIGPDSGRPRGAALGRLIWGPEELYPPGVREALAVVGGPLRERDDPAGWTSELRQLAPRVTVPVRHSLSEHESWWTSGRDGLDEVAALFTAAPVVETAVESGTGHNISLGWQARAYHLRVLAFAEQCLARRIGRGAAGRVPR